MVSCLMVLALVTTLSLGCGEGGGTAKKTIVIGNLTDLTGVAAPALTPMSWGLEDMVNEINAGLNPGPKLPEGVQLEVATWSTGLDPSRFIPGYEWLKQKGSKVMISVLNDCSETLKPLAAADKIAVLGMATSMPMVEPPGWVFAYSCPTRWAIKLMLKWVADHWDYAGKGRKPTIATVGWSDAWGTDNDLGAREYCAANPDKFTYVGAYMAPVGNLSWSGEVAKTLTTDYLNIAANGALMPATFIKEYKAKGGTAINIDTESQSAYVGFIVDSCGWAALDGKLNVQTWGAWSLADRMAEVKYTKDVLYKYHPKEAADVMHAGMGYLGGASMQLFALQMVVAAINRVGADNFTGQAFYDTAINYTADWAGSSRGFTATKRHVVNDMLVLKWDAAKQDLMLVSDGWLDVPHQ